MLHQSRSPRIRWVTEATAGNRHHARLYKVWQMAQNYCLRMNRLLLNYTDLGVHTLTGRAVSQSVNICIQNMDKTHTSDISTTMPECDGTKLNLQGEF